MRWRARTIRSVLTRSFTRDLHDATLIVEPADGGDAQIRTPGMTRVVQWKSRAGQAARILGRLRSRAAIPALERVARDPTDPHLAAEAARALAAIDPDLPIVADLARSGSALTRRATASARRRR